MFALRDELMRDRTNVKLLNSEYGYGIIIIILWFIFFLFLSIRRQTVELWTVVERRKYP